MFEKATRLKLRFSTTKGNLSVEDLWDLTLNQLNELAKNLNKKVKESEEEDFLKELTSKNTTDKLKFDIVLYILNVKKDEKNKAEAAAEKRAEKQKILAIIKDKQDESLKQKSVDELTQLLEKL